MNADKVVHQVNDVTEHLKNNFFPFAANNGVRPTLNEVNHALNEAYQRLYKLSNELNNETHRVELSSHWFADAIKDIDEMIDFHTKQKETMQGHFWYANHEICNNLHHVKRILINHAFQSNKCTENPDILQFMQIVLNNDKMAKYTVEMNTAQRACTFAYNEGFKAGMAAVQEYLTREKDNQNE